MRGVVMLQWPPGGSPKEGDSSVHVKRIESF